MAEIVRDPVRERLTNLTATYQDATESWSHHRDAWQQAITDAVDSGMRLADVARLAGVTQPRIIAIVRRTTAA